MALLKLLVELVPGAKLVPNMPEVFRRSEVRGEVVIAGEEALLSGNEAGIVEGESLSAEGTEEVASLMSAPEEGSV